MKIALNFCYTCYTCYACYTLCYTCFQLCYTDADSFFIHIKTEDFFKDIANDLERWFDTSDWDESDKRPLPIGKNKKIIGLFKYELGGKISIELCALRSNHMPI